MFCLCNTNECMCEWGVSWGRGSSLIGLWVGAPGSFHGNSRSRVLWDCSCALEKDTRCYLFAVGLSGFNVFMKSSLLSLHGEHSVPTLGLNIRIQHKAGLYGRDPSLSFITPMDFLSPYMPPYAVLDAVSVLGDFLDGHYGSQYPPRIKANNTRFCVPSLCQHNLGVQLVLPGHLPK